MSHFGGLLYLFMDVNGLRYEPLAAWTWAESMRPSLSGGEFSACRRTIALLEQGYESVERDLARPFVFRETLRDRLPEWCASLVDAFLKAKAAEGWKKSTIDMFRTCACRFCLFADAIGVTSFADVTADHVKLFNVEDRHATPEGKNAFNSQVRQFLEWLGCRDELSNPHLYLALPNVAAPRETAVVTLTADEQGELERALERACRGAPWPAIAARRRRRAARRGPCSAGTPIPRPIPAARRRCSGTPRSQRRRAWDRPLPRGVSN